MSEILVKKYPIEFKRRLKFFQDFIEDNFKDKKMSLLDAGCGTGYYSQLASDKISYLGVDSDLKQINQLKNSIYNNQFYMNLDLTERRLNKGHFDLIICNQVLEHIDDNVVALRNLYYYLNNNGFLILGVPQEGAWIWRIRNKYLQPNIKKKTDHTHFYVIGDWLNLIRTTGFKNVKPIYWGWGLPLTYLNDFVMRYRLGYHIVNWIGKHFFKSQAIILYFICKK